jgi:hypothetical protein
MIGDIMTRPQTVTGTLINDHTVTLDKPLSMQPMKVRIVIEPLSESNSTPYRPEVVAKIHSAQNARGFRPPSGDEVDS